MSNMVNTVTGQVSADQLGKTLAHEHLLFGYPGYQGDLTLGIFNRALHRDAHRVTLCFSKFSC